MYLSKTKHEPYKIKTHKKKKPPLGFCCCHRDLSNDHESLVGGWTNHLKNIISSNWIISPRNGMKIKGIWNHSLIPMDFYRFPIGFPHRMGWNHHLDHICFIPWIFHPKSPAEFDLASLPRSGRSPAGPNHSGFRYPGETIWFMEEIRLHFYGKCRYKYCIWMLWVLLMVQKSGKLTSWGW